jgi:glycosyltransferase involved in cell wall biosynthesis
MKRLIIYDGYLVKEFASNIEVWSKIDLKSKIRRLGIFHLIGAYSEVIFLTPHLRLHSSPILVMLILWVMSTRRCYVEDYIGNRVKINFLSILNSLFRLFLELCQLPFVIFSIKHKVRSLTFFKSNPSVMSSLGSIEPFLYLKTDLWFTTQAGGSVTHMAGVLNGLSLEGLRPLVFSTASNPLLSKNIQTKSILPDKYFWSFRDVPALRFSQKICEDVKSSLNNERPSFIYQRYSLYSYAAAQLSRELSVPLVTEYNGSELWISKNWGISPRYFALAKEIELLNLNLSDLVVVVSSASRRELIERGIESEKILVNPNGVDPEAFQPNLQNLELRRDLGIENCYVIGFIGTFGPWHGVNKLIEAFTILLDSRHLEKKHLHLLLIGDGVMREEAQKLTVKLGISKYCTFTGLVPQIDSPRYLSCCNLFVAPHISNPDDSPFFGSPTKLFEYMAMGRPLIASCLGQMDELLIHNETAWLVEPGNVKVLANAMADLMADDDAARRMAVAARDEVLAKHTWQMHVNKILDALRNREVSR